MKPPVKLRLDLLPSRQAIALVTVAYVATAALAAVLPADAWLRAAAVIVIGARGVGALRRWAARTTPDAVVAIDVAADRQTTIIWGDGRRSEGFVAAETYVGESVTSIVWRAPDSRRSRAIALLPDMARPDDLRKLRVLLRYSRRVANRPAE